uniref:Uncharacterized protein n=1 Tax=Solanum lycopersicum TaxID=4081 RepID=A0A3Q7HD85_SOLLC
MMHSGKMSNVSTAGLRIMMMIFILNAGSQEVGKQTGEIAGGWRAPVDKNRHITDYPVRTNQLTLPRNLTRHFKPIKKQSERGRQKLRDWNPLQATTIATTSATATTTATSTTSTTATDTATSSSTTSTTSIHDDSISSTKIRTTISTNRLRLGFLFLLRYFVIFKMIST